MSKNIKIKSQVFKSYYVIFFIFLILSSCDTRRGRQVSDTISDSKKRGIFLKEYKPLTNPLRINDTIQLHIDEAWVEYQWRHPGEKGMYITDAFQLCVNVKPEKHLQDLGFGWSIGVDFNLNMRTSSPTSLISDFRALPPDTIVYKVQKGSELSDNYEKIIIGEFVLIEK